MFKIRRTDLAGRIGLLKVKGLSIETPAYLPVIHPVNQLIPPRDIYSMGFKAVITNSYIIYKSYGDDAVKKGLREILGYEGLIMTDSGGYQVLEYGRIDVDPLEIAEYQARIGSDIAVILDKPTGIGVKRGVAEETVLLTLDSARKSLCVVEKQKGRQLWVLPVQGGDHLDLVEFSARESSKLPYDIYAIGSPVEIMNNYEYSKLANIIIRAKNNLPPEKPVHLFGAGHPLTIALIVALGVDLFDSASYILFAKQEKYMTYCGVRDLNGLDELPCNCPVCNRLSPTGFKDLPRDEKIAELAKHNLYVLKNEVEATRQAVKEGRLWEYLMQKLKCHPSLYSVRRVIKENLGLLSEGTSLFKKRALLLFDSIDVQRPELVIFRERLSRTLKPHDKGAQPVKLLVALYVESPSEYYDMVGVLGEETFIAQPFVGISPLELIDMYPVSQNVKPDADSLGEDVLDETATIVMGILSRWGVERVELYLKDDKSSKLAVKLAEKARSNNIKVLGVKRS